MTRLEKTQSRNSERYESVVVVAKTHTHTHTRTLLKHSSLSISPSLLYKQMWEDKLVDKIYPMQEKMDIMKDTCVEEPVTGGVDVIESVRKRPVAKTNRRKRRGTFSKYAKPSARSMHLIRKRKHEARKQEEIEIAEVPSRQQDIRTEQTMTTSTNVELQKERQQLFETSGLNEVASTDVVVSTKKISDTTTNMSKNNTTTTGIDGLQTSTGIGLSDMMGLDLDLDNLEISEDDMQMLEETDDEEDEVDEMELLMKEEYKGSNKMWCQILGKCQNAANNDTRILFRLKHGVAKINGNDYVFDAGTCILER